MPKRVGDLFNSIFEAADVLIITEEIDHLAETYVPKVLSRQNTRTTPKHVAACTVNRIDFLVNGKLVIGASGLDDRDSCHDYRPTETPAVPFCGAFLRCHDHVFANTNFAGRAV
jgi:hypothetical protein